MTEDIQIYKDSPTLTAAAADQFVALARDAVHSRGVFHVALAGGSTPKRLYHLLAERSAGKYKLPWDHIQIWYGDERHVGPDDPDSNYRMSKVSLLDTVLPPEENIHRIPAEHSNAADAAADYETEMMKYFPEAVDHNTFPVFDLILLGMGPDGHTASLFPGTKALDEKGKWVTANWVPANEVVKEDTWRITFTYPMLNHARNVTLFVAGAEKADRLYDVLEASKGTDKYPVQRVKPAHGTKTWMLDEAAAAKLTIAR